MKTTFYLLSALVLDFSLFALEAYARAGGGGGGGGGGGFGGSRGGRGDTWWMVLPIALVMYVYRKARISSKASKVSDALRKIAVREPQWNQDSIIDFSEKTFKKVQKAWSEQDLESLKELLHPHLYMLWERDIQDQISEGERNLISSVKITDILIINVQNYLEDEKDKFTVLITASCIDKIYRGKKLVEDHSSPFEELWTFEWENGKWKLYSVDQFDAWGKFVNRKIINEARKIGKKAA